MNIAAKYRLVISCAITLLLAQAANSAERVVLIDYAHALRIPHNKVTVDIDALGNLTLEVQSLGGEKTVSRMRISERALADLKKELSSINWAKVGEDHLRGPDGTEVRISCNDTDVRLWSPDYDPEKRGLKEAQLLIERVFKLAGLDKIGMPRKLKTTH